MSSEDAKSSYQAATAPAMDPFPDIPPALLNSADICQYVDKLRIIRPFHKDEIHLKSASYRVDFAGDLYEWEGDPATGDFSKEVPTGTPIEKNVSYTIKPNSICFVDIDVIFDLPLFIAVRFNLSITHVHAGLLLGTGPLIDPGFKGRILVPLHNLTSRPYVIRGAESLLWLEFTKVSPHPDWNPKSAPGPSRFGFPADKMEKEASKYLKEAAQDYPIASSVAVFVRRAEAEFKEIDLRKREMEERARTLEASGEKLSKRVTVFGTGAIVASVAVNCAVMIWSLNTFQTNVTQAAVSVIQDANKYVREAEKSAQDIARDSERRATETSDAKIKALEARISVIEKKDRKPQTAKLKQEQSQLKQ